MPAAKLCSSGTLNATKSEEGNDSLDTFVNQAGKEPLLPFSRTVDSPVPWIQLLHAFDQPDLPGWPLMAPLKVQMQKCEKCSREFCSPINYRRHIRVHRRSLNVNKESHKNRDLLAAFWDKLSLEQAKEVVSFNDVMLKEIPGSSVIRALASSLQKPGVWSLPQIYVKAGSTLLEIIQAKPSRLPISSQELFSILDDASERTFLCAGTPECVQKYVFDGETAKNSLELKNLVASTSFVFEHALVKAWVADKDAEALRCQKLLVEEEEAAQRRQAVLLERKKQKKLRQKEQKAKEQLYEHNGDLNTSIDTIDRPTSTGASGPSSPSDSTSDSPDIPSNTDSSLESNQTHVKESDKDIEAQIDFSENINSQSSELVSNSHRHLATNRWQAPKSQRGSRYGLHVSSNHQTLKTEHIHKQGPFKDRNMPNGNKVWTKKVKIDSHEDSLKPSSKESKCEVIIGSISVTLNSSQPDKVQDLCRTEQPIIEKKNAKENLNQGNTVQSSSAHVPSKHWRRVSRGEAKSVLSVDKYVQEGRMPFSSAAAKEFLAQRWKEAIAADHVTLVLSSGAEPRGDENQIGGSTVQVKSSKKTEKSLKIKYVPKQRHVA